MSKKENLDFFAFTRDPNKSQIFDDFRLISKKKWGQSGDKTRDKTRDKLGTKWGQTRDKLGTKWGQTGDKTGDKTGDNVSEILRLENMSGLQLKCLIYIFKLCNENGGLETGIVKIESIANEINSSVESAKKTIRRLVKKNAIKKLRYKNGRGGFTVYGINELVFSKILDLPKLGTKWGQSGDKTRDRLRLEQKPSSSNLYNDNNLTTTTLRSVGIVETSGDSVKTWQDINFDPLEDIGFKEAHIAQLLTKGELTADEIQESIHAFAYDMAYNKELLKIKTTPLNLFLGILKRGTPYFPSSQYETMIEREYKKQLAKKDRRKERDNEIMAKHREESYAEWVKNLSPDQKSVILDIDIAFIEKMPLEAIKKLLMEYHDTVVYKPLLGSDSQK